MPRGIPRDKSTQHQIIHRYKIARGHLDKVIEMVEKGHYCIDVIDQTIAVESALKKAGEAVLENHMRTCVSDAIKKGKSDEVITEVMRVMDKG